MSTVSSDVFFYHDTVDVSEQIKADLLVGLTLPVASLFYNRSYGCDFSPIEGAPNSLFMQVVIAYAVALFIANRNRVVTDGTSGSVDRRALASQDMVSVTPNGKNLDVGVGYIETRNPQGQHTLRWTMGGTR